MPPPDHLEISPTHFSLLSTSMSLIVSMKTQPAKRAGIAATADTIGVISPTPRSVGNALASIENDLRGEDSEMFIVSFRL